jgi:hypothetical protein
MTEGIRVGVGEDNENLHGLSSQEQGVNP